MHFAAPQQILSFRLRFGYSYGMSKSIHLITLGVEDLNASLAFYERFGWTKAPESVDGNVVFFQANGFVLGLYPQDKLSADTGQTGIKPVPGGITIGQNFESRNAMKDGLSKFISAGGTILREPFEAPWGLIAYAADIDGHVWEFAHVPGFEPDADGRLILPSGKTQ